MRYRIDGYVRDAKANRDVPLVTTYCDNYEQALFRKAALEKLGALNVTITEVDDEESETTE